MTTKRKNRNCKKKKKGMDSAPNKIKIPISVKTLRSESEC